MEVILYSTGCPKCKTLKKLLEQKDVKYIEENSIDTMLSLGIVQVPMVSVAGEMKNYSAAVEWLNNI